MEMSVVLPAPLGPSNPNSSPSVTEKLTPLSASSRPYHFLRSSTTSNWFAIRTPVLLAYKSMISPGGNKSRWLGRAKPGAKNFPVDHMQIACDDHANVPYLL